MIPRYLLFTSLIIFVCTNIIAQQNHGAVFNSYNSIGFVAGKLPVSFATQTENGVKYKNWFAGAGFGIDTYFWKSLPLFFAVKKEFSFKNSGIILYVNTGKNIIKKNRKIVGTFSTIETQGGFYGDAGAGYKIKITKSSNIFFTLGNTVKHIKQTEESINTGFPYSYTTQHKLSRIAFKIGYQF
jgi:hypothetical protein